jgi:pimeloyl-ACP methyl ester carboxylesterase
MPSTAVSVDGSRIGYESFGGGPPMLLVHGTSATHIRWVPVRGVLAQHYTVHEMDRRGRGLSTDEADAYSLRREAQDVAAVAEAIGGDVYVVAHSFGAVCTIEAAQITSAFRRLALYEPRRPTPGLNDVPPELAPRLMTMRDREEILEAFYRKVLRLPQAAIDGHARYEDLASAADRGAHARTGARRGQCLPGRRRHQAIDLDPEQFVHAVLEFDSNPVPRTWRDR